MENHQDHYEGNSEAGKAQRNISSAVQVDAGDDAFESILKDFETLFQNKQDSMDVYTAKVVQICNQALSAADIRHTAIASRIKTWKSAEGSIRRKKLERSLRQQLRDAVESKGLKWDIYCAHSSLGPGTMGSFESAVEMLHDLHDFGGARISLYFPGDIERISYVLAERFELVREVRKHQSMDVITTLQRRLQDFDANAPVDGIHQSHTEWSFSGYKATHFIVRLQEKDIPSNRIAVWKDLLVEIQVGTLVMHAWSEIEHDMIYKPLESQAISEDEIRLLDLINGIVATGESALGQLEASTKKRLNQRVKDKEAFAMSHHELGHWLEKYWVEANKLQGNWEYLEQLYAIAKATGDHQLGRIQQVLEKIDSEEVTHRGILPVKMLEVMCQPLANLKRPQLQEMTTVDFVANARFWALQLIHGLNMAMFLGVAGEFFDVDGLPARPRVASFLDILHPTRACYSDIAAVHVIVDYCKAVLESGHKSQLVRIATRLPRTGRVIASSEPGVGLLIPAIFVYHFVTAEGEVDYGDYHGCREMAISEVQQSINFIEFFLGHGNDTEGNMLAIWDKLTSAFPEDANKVPAEWFLVPNLSQEIHEAPWKLVTRPLHLDVVRPPRYINIVSHDRNKLHETFFEDEISSFECRLHPKTHWEKIHRARNMSKLQQHQMSVNRVEAASMRTECDNRLPEPPLSLPIFINAMPSDSSLCLQQNKMNNQRIRVAIIGGGLAGATVANALFRLQHADVHVFETAPEFSERGAAVGLSVNAQQALNLIMPDYKYMLERAGAVPMSSSRTILGSGKDVGTIIFDLKTGVCVHRASLLRELLAPLPAEILHPNKQLVAINSKASGTELTFKDDTKYVFDAVIGADGIFSSVRRHIFRDTTRPEDYEPSPAGFWDCRSLVPIDKAKAVLGEQLFNDDRRYSWLGKGAFIMHDILEDKTMVQCIVSAIEREQHSSESRKQILTRENLTDTLHAWLDGPIASGIIDLTLNDSSTHRYSQWEHKVTPTYANDRVCIMGDAAHASTPWMGAGAGIALEDAMVLGKLIANVSSAEEIAVAFKAYDALRRPRCQKVVDTSRDTGLLFCGEYGLDAAELRAQISTRWNFILQLDMEEHIQEALAQFARIKNSE